MVQKAIEAKARYLLFLDEDVIWPPEGVKVLLYNLENHPDWSVVGGLYFTKSNPPEPLIYQETGMGAYWNFKLGDMIKITGFMGSGFHLYRVSDLEAMKLPQEYEEKDPWNNVPMKVREYFKTTSSYYKIKPGNYGKTGGTEDAFFYDMAIREGLQCWMNTGIICQHIDVDSGKVYSVSNDNLMCTKPDAWNHFPRIANLGAGGMLDPHEVNVDMQGDSDFKCDITQLPLNWEGQFDAVKANQVLEHFDFGKTREILTEWTRILKPGGVLQVEVPDVAVAAKQILDTGELDMQTKGMLWGDQGNPYWRQPKFGGFHDGKYVPHSLENNHHKAGFTEKSLADDFEAVGLTEIIVTNIHGYYLRVAGRKPLETQAPPPSDKLVFKDLNDPTLVRPPQLIGEVIQYGLQETPQPSSQEGGAAQDPGNQAGQQNPQEKAGDQAG